MLHLGIGFGRYFGSFLDPLLELLGVRRPPTFHQKSMRKLLSEKKVPRRPGCQKVSPAGARRGVKGEVNLPPGGRRFGRKEEKKKGKLGGR